MNYQQFLNKKIAPVHIEKRKLCRWELLKTSWKYQFKEFFNNSNLHGVRYISEQNRPFHERFIWFSFIVIEVVLTLVIVSSLWEKFLTSPTITGLDTDFYKWNVPFPAVTVCPTHRFLPEDIEEYVSSFWEDLPVENAEQLNYYRKFVASVTNFSLTNVEDLLPFVKDTTLTNIFLKDIIKQTSIKCEKLFDDCTWKGDKLDCCDLFNPVLTELGFCYTFNSNHFERNFTGSVLDDDVQSTQIKYIYETDTDISFIFNSLIVDDNPLEVYIHSHAERIFHSEFQTSHVWTRRMDKILFSSKETYTTEDTRQLSISQRRCIFWDEIPLATDHIYTYSGCMIQCKMEFSMAKCRCVPFLYPELDGFRYCNINEMICIYNYSDEIIHGYHCDHCELSCMNTVYDIEKLEDREKEVHNTPLEVGFVSWPLIRYKRDVLFGWVDLFVAIGGIAGLFLGFSVLTVVETVYFFTLRAFCMTYLEEEKLIELHEQYANTEEPEINLEWKLINITIGDEQDSEDENVDEKNNIVQSHQHMVLPYLP